MSSLYAIARSDISHPLIREFSDEQIVETVEILVTEGDKEGITFLIEEGICPLELVCIVTIKYAHMDLLSWILDTYNSITWDIVVDVARQLDLSLPREIV